MIFYGRKSQKKQMILEKGKKKVIGLNFLLVYVNFQQNENNSGG